jgi:Zn-dependent protease
MKFRISDFEKRELFKAWAAISFAFAIAFGGGMAALASPNFMLVFLVAGFTVGIGFIGHELAHKLVAMRYGCWAEFRAFNQMLVMAIVFSFFGFVFAAPGGVFIKGRITKEKNGHISAAGIVANLIVAALFLTLALAIPVLAIQTICLYGMLINSWLALFNLIPFMGFDGSKVLAWNKIAYGILVFLAFALMFLSNEIVLA